MRACSIDVGKVNLGVYIEEFTQTTAKGLYLKRVDLTEKKSERVTPRFLSRLFTYLDSLSDLLQTCDYIIIEKQLRANPEAQFVDHALQSYFVLRNHNGVTPFSSKNKTRLFDSTKMTKYQRKKWSTNKALEILETRGETDLLEYVRSLKKKDDVSDAMCQLDAWKILKFGDSYGWQSTRPFVPLTPTTPTKEKKSRTTKKQVSEEKSDSPVESQAVDKPKKSRKKVQQPPVESQAVDKPKKSRKKVQQPPAESQAGVQQPPAESQAGVQQPPAESQAVDKPKKSRKKVQQPPQAESQAGVQQSPVETQAVDKPKKSRKKVQQPQAESQS
jgi:hypothetical protein